MPAAIAYPDASGMERLSVFVRASDGTLNENYWDGGTWRWYPHGRAPGMDTNYTIGAPAAVTYRDQSGVQHVYVFVCAMGSGGDGPHLFVRWWNGWLWQWGDQGRGCAGTTDASAITYLDRDGLQRVFVFVTSPQGHLLVNYWDGRLWRWADQGLPPDGTNIVNGPAPASMSYADAAGVQHLYVFAEGGTEHIYVNWWDGGAWHWADQGTPATGLELEHPAALTYRDTAGVQWINTYVGAFLNPHLYNNWWDGSTWRWRDQGTQANAPGEFWPAGVTYLDSVGTRLIAVFSINSGANDTGGHLYVNYWDGSTWRWADQGLAPGSVPLVGRPAVVTF
jgi:hypothetical protein